MELRDALLGCGLSVVFAASSLAADPSPQSAVSTVPDVPAPASSPLHCPAPRTPSEDSKTASKDGLLRYYPDRAARANMSGRVVLDCLIETGGLLGDCKVVSETPSGWNFGEAALKMSALFKMARGVECSRARVPIDFKPPH